VHGDDDVSLQTGRSELPGGEIFINYRGADSRSYSAVLYLEAARRFGPERVFLDYVSIPAGADYPEHLLGRVRRAGVVLAVIGPDWLARPGLFRRPRVWDTRDWIRRELAEAFAAGIRVVPVLVDDAELPAAERLPPCLAPLARCQFRRLRVREALGDLDRIMRDLEAVDAGLALAAKRRSSPPVPAAGDRPTAERLGQLARAAASAVQRQQDAELLLPRTREQAPRPVRRRRWRGGRWRGGR
jgi:TIR domain-containing protein